MFVYLFNSGENGQNYDFVEKNNIISVTSCSVARWFPVITEIDAHR